jgi:quinol monooxygenase YgiN
MAAAAATIPPALAQAAPATLPLVELRRYRTHPGRRDDLIALFEREFVESQEAVGMKIIATFREPAAPERFTWLRGFTDMAARGKGLNDFYYGPVWQAHRTEANDTLDDNDDVLLLREAAPGSGFAPASRPRAAVGAPAPAHGVVVAVVAYPKDPAAFPARFETGIRPRLEATGGRVLARFVREHAVNNFPRLPVREADEVFVWFEGFRDQAAWDASRQAVDRAAAAAGEGAARTADVLVLEPTARSELRG